MSTSSQLQAITETIEARNTCTNETPKRYQIDGVMNLSVIPDAVLVAPAGAPQSPKASESKSHLYELHETLGADGHYLSARCGQLPSVLFSEELFLKEAASVASARLFASSSDCTNEHPHVPRPRLLASSGGIYQDPNDATERSKNDYPLDVKPQSFNDDDQVSSAVLSLLNPSCGKIVHVPDTAFDMTVWRTVTGTYTFNAPNVVSTSLMIVQHWGSNRTGAKLYMYDLASGRYVKGADIPISSNLPNNYFFAKAWSGSVSMLAGSTPGGGLQGQMTGATLQVLPNDDPEAICLLNSANLSALAMNELAFATAKAYKGLVSTRPSGGTNDYLPFSIFTGDVATPGAVPSTQTSVARNVTSDNLAFVVDSIPASGGFTVTAPITIAGPNPYFDSSLVTGFIGANEDGPVRLRGNLSLSTLVTGVNSAAARVVFTRRTINLSTAVVTASTSTYSIPFCASTLVGGSSSVAIDVFDAARFNSTIGHLIRVQIFIDITGAIGSQMQRNVNPGIYQSLSLESYLNANAWSAGPVYIGFAEGLGAGQSLSIETVYGYSVIPTARTASISGVGTGGSEDYLEASLVESIFEKAAELGVRYVYPMEEYQQKVADGTFVHIARKRTYRTLQAASMSKYMKFLPLAMRIAGGASGMNQLGETAAQMAELTIPKAAARKKLQASDSECLVEDESLWSQPRLLASSAGIVPSELQTCLASLIGSLSSPASVSDLPAAAADASVLTSLDSHASDVLFSELSVFLFGSNTALRVRTAYEIAAITQSLLEHPSTLELEARSFLNRSLVGPKPHQRLLASSGAPYVDGAYASKARLLASSTDEVVPAVLSQREIAPSQHLVTLQVPDLLNFERVAALNLANRSVAETKNPRAGYAAAPLYGEGMANSKMLFVVLPEQLSTSQLAASNLSPYSTLLIEGAEYSYSFSMHKGKPCVYDEFVAQLTASLAFSPQDLAGCAIHTLFDYEEVSGTSAGLALYAALRGVCSRDFMFTGGYASRQKAGGGEVFLHTMITHVAEKMTVAPHLIVIARTIEGMLSVPNLANNWVDYSIDKVLEQTGKLLPVTDELVFVNYFKANQPAYLKSLLKDAPRTLQAAQKPNSKLLPSDIAHINAQLASKGQEPLSSDLATRRQQLRSLSRTDPSLFTGVTTYIPDAPSLQAAQRRGSRLLPADYDKIRVKLEANGGSLSADRKQRANQLKRLSRVNPAIFDGTSNFVPADSPDALPPRPARVRRRAPVLAQAPPAAPAQEPPMPSGSTFSNFMKFAPMLSRVAGGVSGNPLIGEGVASLIEMQDPSLSARTRRRARVSIVEPSAASLRRGAAVSRPASAATLRRGQAAAVMVKAPTQRSQRADSRQQVHQDARNPRPTAASALASYKMLEAAQHLASNPALFAQEYRAAYPGQNNVKFITESQNPIRLRTLAYDFLAHLALTSPLYAKEFVERYAGDQPPGLLAKWHAELESGIPPFRPRNRASGDEFFVVERAGSASLGNHAKPQQRAGTPARLS